MTQLKSSSSSSHPAHLHRPISTSTADRTPCSNRSVDLIITNHSKHPIYLHPHRPPFLSSSPSSSSSPSKMNHPPLQPPSSPLASSRHRPSTLMRKLISKPKSSSSSSLHRRIQNFDLNPHPRSSSSSPSTPPSPPPFSSSPRLSSSSSSSSFPSRKIYPAHRHPSSFIPQPIPSSPIKSTSNPTSSLPVTPKRPFHTFSLLDTVLSSSSASHHPPSHDSIGFRRHGRPQSCLEREKTSLCQKLTRDGIQVTPNKLSRALSSLIAEKKSIKHGDKQVAMQNLIQTLQSLRSKQESFINHDLSHCLEPQRKRIKIESAPDGSASVVVASISPERHHHPSDTIDPSKLLPPCNHSPDIHSIHRSSLVSADIQDYGRVAIKKEALIGKLGLEAALKAIRKANRGRIHPHPPRSRSTPPSSPQTDSLRSCTIAKWLDSTDDNDDEDERDRAITRKDPPSHPSHERSSTRGHEWMDGLTQFTQLDPVDHSQPNASYSDPSAPAVDDLKIELPAQSLDPSTILVGQSLGCASLVESQTNLDTTRSNSILSHQHPSKPMDRSSTPPNQLSSFLNYPRSDRENDLKSPHHLFGPFSHLSLPHSTSFSSSNTHHGMLKPGCNPNQSFLSLAPSPTIMLTNTEQSIGGMMVDEKELTHRAGTGDFTSHQSGFLGVTLPSSAHPRDPISPQAFRLTFKNDFPPCSPARRPQVTKSAFDSSAPLVWSENSPMDRKLTTPLDYGGVGSPTGDRHWLSDLDLNRDHSNPHFSAHHPDLPRPAFCSSPSNLNDRENHHLILEDLFDIF